MGLKLWGNGLKGRTEMKKETFYDDLVRLVAEPQEEWIKRYKDFFGNGDKKSLYKQKLPRKLTIVRG
jgi:hypothetical protein